MTLDTKAARAIALDSHDFEKRWMIHAGRHRYVAKDAKIHPAVYERMKLVPGYDPPNLPGPPPPAS